MKAKMRVIFEPSVIKTSEVERRLKFIENLPIKAVSPNFQDLNELEIEVFFGNDKIARIHPVGAENVFYTNLEKIKDCYINSNTTCVNISPAELSETYSFFYYKNK